jgi:predicted component of type VI protein secretion system
MPARLVALDEGPDIPLAREPIMVGRHPLCDVRLPSFRVSRRHCCLTELDGVVIVRDLGSTNGTLINSRRVESGRLRPGDELAIANLRYRLEPGPADRASTADPRSGLSEDGASRADLRSTRPFDEC